MAICEITGKGKMYGHNVSFSQRHNVKAVFFAQVQFDQVFANPLGLDVDLDNRSIFGKRDHIDKS